MNQTVKSAFYSHKRFFYTRGVGGQRKSPPHPTGIPDATGFVQCALWGSNPRPADYQTQSPKTRHTAQQPAPHRGFYIALLLWMCNQSQHTEKRKPCFGNHIRATLRPGNSPPEKRTPRQKPVNIGFNTSRVHIRRPPP